MENNKPAQSKIVEPRWLPALSVITVFFLLKILPERVRTFPVWFSYLSTFIVLASMIAVNLSGGLVRWRRIERLIILIFFIITSCGNLIALTYLIQEMIYQSGKIDGLELLSSSIGVWVVNVLAFSLLYWQIDRGGPEARINNATKRPDWLFPQTGVPDEAPPDWRPTFIDYLFLAFSTATAFSPTDALPLTSRAKVLMMLESMVSLTTIIVVASRAINILGN